MPSLCKHVYISCASKAGASLLLMDDDTCASNAMTRDAKMKALVAADKEPITPFISRVRSLAENGISSILVVGGSGEFFSVVRLGRLIYFKR